MGINPTGKIASKPLYKHCKMIIITAIIEHCLAFFDWIEFVKLGIEYTISHITNIAEIYQAGPFKRLFIAV